MSEVDEASAASRGSHGGSLYGGGFNRWLESIGKTRETATDADEIQWLRLDRQRLRLTAQERDAIDKGRLYLIAVAHDNAFIDEVCDAAKEAADALQSLLSRHG